MNKKGFTLMELLATFVILAILALVTAPIITNVLKDARKNTFEASVDELVNVINMDYSEYGRVGEVTYYFDGTDLVCVNCVPVEGGADTNLFLDYTGELKVEDVDVPAELKNKNGKVTGTVKGTEFTAVISENKVAIQEEENNEN